MTIEVELVSDTGATIKLPDLVAGKHYQNYWADSGENLVDAVSHEKYLEDGVLKFSFDTGQNTTKILLKATYTSEDGDSVEASLEAVKYVSTKKRFITATPATTNVKADEYSIFHVKANFILDRFQYLVSK